MAKNDKVKKERRRAMFAAMEGLRPQKGFPVPPRKAMSQANKASKKLAYPLAPYPGASLLQLYRWGSAEWQSLGRWQNLALPVVVLVSLLTWEKERGIQDDYWAVKDKEEDQDQGHTDVCRPQHRPQAAQEEAAGHHSPPQRHTIGRRGVRSAEWR